MLNKTLIRQIQVFNNEDILIEVKNGKGKLTSKYIENKPGKVFDDDYEVRKVLYLDGTPLILSNAESCPTCSSMIALAEGRDEAHEDVVRILNDINNIDGLEDGIEKIKPILSLLDDGYYILKEIECFPTDGEGNYFWNLKRDLKRYRASSEYYYEKHGDCITLGPKFLLPSQGTNSYDEERVEFYREKIRRGEKLVGLAIEDRGYLATLLDGHHKATACYLEGKAINCITIIETNFIDNYRYKEEYLCYMGNIVFASKLKEVDTIREFFSKKDIKNNTICGKIIVEDRYTKPIEIEKMENVFPLCDEYALSQIHNESYKEQRKRREEEFAERIRYDLWGAIKSDEEKARRMCFSILETDEMNTLTMEAVSILHNYTDNEVQELFRELLIKYESSNSQYTILKYAIEDYFLKVK